MMDRDRWAAVLGVETDGFTELTRIAGLDR